MSIKKILHDFEEGEPQLMEKFIFQDLAYWDGEELRFDIGYEFNEMPETKSLDLNYSYKSAVNELISMHRDMSLLEDGEPVVIIREKLGDENSKIYKVLSMVPVEDKNFANTIMYKYPDAEMINIPINQRPYEIGMDKSLTAYLYYSDIVEDNLIKLLDHLHSYREHYLLKFPEFECRGHKISGISQHVGIDRDNYYNLEIDGTTSVGMNYRRLHDFFIVDDLKSMSSLSCGLENAVENLKKPIVRRETGKDKGPSMH